MGHRRGARNQRGLVGRVVLAVVALAWAGSTGIGSRAAEAHPVLTAVGDISTCTGTSDEATAALAAAVAGPIAALGDLVEGRAPNEYQDCFEPTWGALKPRIHPVPGDNGEYGRNPAGAGAVTKEGQLAAYHAYFGAAAGAPGRTWYGYTVGNWRIIALDSNCVDEETGCPEDHPMVQWLKADLAANPSLCTAVTMHHTFVLDSGRTRGGMRHMLQAMYDHGVDLVLSGHRHTYRRYAPVDLAGVGDDTHGIRQFVVGTGGHRRNEGNVAVGGTLQVSHGDSWGVLRLTLKPGGYDFQFVPAVMSGSVNFTDSGSGTCHWGPGGAPANTPTTTAPPSGTTPTTAPPSGTTPTTAPGPAPAGRSGYWMLGADGRVYPFGDAQHSGDAAGHLATPDAVNLEPTPSQRGYWVVDRLGRVFAFGDAVHHGQVEGSALEAGEQATSLSATPTGRGYWVFTTRGRVVPFGDAVPYGDMAHVALNGPVLDSIPTPSGQGYYMVASDGGIFAFGDARFYGSMGGQRLNAPVQSLVPDGDGVGYWLVASDGGIFAFEAPFRGSMGDKVLNKPVTGMVRFGDGYLMVAEDGGIFNFSDRPFHGSLGDRPPAQPIVSVAVLER